MEGIPPGKVGSQAIEGFKRKQQELDWSLDTDWKVEAAKCPSPSLHKSMFPSWLLCG